MTVILRGLAFVGLVTVSAIALLYGMDLVDRAWPVPRVFTRPATSPAPPVRPRAIATSAVVVP
jgi:hypothetical protein